MTASVMVAAGLFVEVGNGISGFGVVDADPQELNKNPRMIRTDINTGALLGIINLLFCAGEGHPSSWAVKIRSFVSGQSIEL